MLLIVSISCWLVFRTSPQRLYRNEYELPGETLRAIARNLAVTTIEGLGSGSV